MNWMEPGPAFPLKERKRIEGEFPVLARLARRYLAIPATNASVERLFSDAGNVYSEKRKALDPDTASMVIFLYSNRRFFWPLVESESEIDGFILLCSCKRE